MSTKVDPVTKDLPAVLPHVGTGHITKTMKKGWEQKSVTPCEIAEVPPLNMQNYNEMARAKIVDLARSLALHIWMFQPDVTLEMCDKESLTAERMASWLNELQWERKARMPAYTGTEFMTAITHLNETKSQVDVCLQAKSSVITGRMVRSSHMIIVGDSGLSIYKAGGGSRPLKKDLEYFTPGGYSNATFIQEGGKGIRWFFAETREWVKTHENLKDSKTKKFPKTIPYILFDNLNDTSAGGKPFPKDSREHQTLMQLYDDFIDFVNQHFEAAISVVTRRSDKWGYDDDQEYHRVEITKKFAKDGDFYLIDGEKFWDGLSEFNLVKKKSGYVNPCHHQDSSGACLLAFKWDYLLVQLFAYVNNAVCWDVSEREMIGELPMVVPRDNFKPEPVKSYKKLNTPVQPLQMGGQGASSAQAPAVPVQKVVPVGSLNIFKRRTGGLSPERFRQILRILIGYSTAMPQWWSTMPEDMAEVLTAKDEKAGRKRPRPSSSTNVGPTDGRSRPVGGSLQVDDDSSVARPSAKPRAGKGVWDPAPNTPPEGIFEVPPGNVSAFPTPSGVPSSKKQKMPRWRPDRPKKEAMPATTHGKAEAVTVISSESETGGQEVSTPASGHKSTSGQPVINANMSSNKGSDSEMPQAKEEYDPPTPKSGMPVKEEPKKPSAAPKRRLESKSPSHKGEPPQKAQKRGSAGTVSKVPAKRRESFSAQERKELIKQDLIQKLIAIAESRRPPQGGAPAAAAPPAEPITGGDLEGIFGYLGNRPIDPLDPGRNSKGFTWDQKGSTHDCVVGLLARRRFKDPGWEADFVGTQPPAEAAQFYNYGNIDDKVDPFNETLEIANLHDVSAVWMLPEVTNAPPRSYVENWDRPLATQLVRILRIEGCLFRNVQTGGRRRWGRGLVMDTGGWFLVDDVLRQNLSFHGMKATVGILCRIAQVNNKSRFQISVARSKATGRLTRVVGIRVVTGHHWWLDDERLATPVNALHEDAANALLNRHMSALNHKTVSKNLLSIAQWGLRPGGLELTQSHSGRMTTNMGMFIEGDRRNVVGGRRKPYYDATIIFDAEETFANHDLQVVPNGIITTREAIPFNRVEKILLHKLDRNGRTYEGVPTSETAEVLYAREYSDSVIVGHTGGIGQGQQSDPDAGTPVGISLQGEELQFDKVLAHPIMIARGEANDIQQSWGEFTGSLTQCPTCSTHFPTGFTRCLSCHDRFDLGLNDVLVSDEKADTPVGISLQGDNASQGHASDVQDVSVTGFTEKEIEEMAKAEHTKGVVGIHSAGSKAWNHIRGAYKWQFEDWPKMTKAKQEGFAKNGTSPLTRGADVVAPWGPETDNPKVPDIGAIYFWAKKYREAGKTWDFQRCEYAAKIASSVECYVRNGGPGVSGQELFSMKTEHEREVMRDIQARCNVIIFGKAKPKYEDLNEYQKSIAGKQTSKMTQKAKAAYAAAQQVYIEAGDLDVACAAPVARPLKGPPPKGGTWRPVQPKGPPPSKPGAHPPVDVCLQGGAVPAKARPMPAPASSTVSRAQTPPPKAEATTSRNRVRDIREVDREKAAAIERAAQDVERARGFQHVAHQRAHQSPQRTWTPVVQTPDPAAKACRPKPSAPPPAQKGAGKGKGLGKDYVWRQNQYHNSNQQHAAPYEDDPEAGWGANNPYRQGGYRQNQNWW